MARNPYRELLSVGDQVVVKGDTFTTEEGKIDRLGVITSVDKGRNPRENGYHVKIEGFVKPIPVHVTEAVRLDEKFPFQLGLVYKK